MDFQGGISLRVSAKTTQRLIGFGSFALMDFLVQSKVEFDLEGAVEAVQQWRHKQVREQRGVRRSAVGCETFHQT